jgi:hypothetical protein
MKTCTKTVNETTFKTSGKSIEIQYNNEGCPYFMNSGKRAFLSDYIRTNYGGKSELFDNNLHAYDSTNSYYPDFIELDTRGETVKIWRIIR